MRAAETIRAIAATALLIAAAPAYAETPLTDFSGQWAGRGTDRDNPLEKTQPTQCRVTVTADPTHMRSDTKCEGRRGLSKRFRLALTFNGNKFTGTAEQTSSRRGSDAAPTQRNGTVTGSRNGDTANFTVHLPGLTPNAHVVLTLTSPTSFSMRVSSLGATLTDVNFRRPAAR
jgi:hypothetical protein